VTRRLNFYARNQRTANIIFNTSVILFIINLHFSISTDDASSNEKAITFDPKSFEMKPLQIAPKIEISGGVYLIPAEKVFDHAKKINRAILCRKFLPIAGDLRGCKSIVQIERDVANDAG
jgi:hypothetical protein